MKNLSLAGLFVALGLVLPAGFHSLGLGRAFLPMHIPVIMAGIYLGWRWGVVVGAITPILSAVLTAMPTMPVAFTMVLELPIYAATAALTYARTKNAFVAVLVAALAGRVVYGLAGSLLFPLLGLPPVAPLYPVTAGLLSGLAGVAVQLILIPLLVSRIKPARR